MCAHIRAAFVKVISVTIQLLNFYLRLSLYTETNEHIIGSFITKDIY